MARWGRDNDVAMARWGRGNDVAMARWGRGNDVATTWQWPAGVVAMTRGNGIAFV